MELWGLNWVFTQGPDRAFVNHRFAASTSPLPGHMTNRGKRLLPLPAEYPDHTIISNLPLSPPLPELVREPELEPKESRWAEYWHCLLAAWPLWAFKMCWDFLRDSIVRLFWKPVGVIVGVLQNINWYTVLGVIAMYPVAKLVVPAYDGEVVYASKPLYVMFTPAAARARTGSVL